MSARRSLGRLWWLVLLGAGVGPLQAQERFNHAPFDRLLASHVRGERVDYDAFAGAPDFTAYLAALGAARPNNLPESERLAFWINAYNAFTIELINRHGERRSIRRINRGRGGPWGLRFIQIDGRDLTLDDIEHRIIRREFREPRIHFALVCASLGCPPLRREAYRSDVLDRQLEEQAVAFLASSPEKNRYDLETRTAHLSSLFKFRDYLQDFGGSREALGRYVAAVLRRGGRLAEAEMLESGAFKLRYTNYDWGLNGPAEPRGEPDGDR